MARDELRALLLVLSPSPRDKLRLVLVRDQADHDAIAAELLRYGDANGDQWAGIIDMISMYPDARREVVQVLGQIQAESVTSRGVV